MKKWVIVVISVAVAAAICFAAICVAVGAAIYNNQPAVVVQNALIGAAEDLLQRNEIEPILNMLQKGSLEVNATADSEKAPEEFGSNSLKADVGGKLYFSKDSLFLENLHADVESSRNEVDVEFSAELYASSEYSYISNDNILNGTYGIKREGITEAFKNSFIAQKLSEEKKESLITVLEAYEDENSDDFKKDSQKIAKRYGKLLAKSVKSNALFESDTKTVQINNEPIDCRVVTVTIDGKTTVAVLNALYDELREDKELREFAIKYSDRLKGTGIFGEEEFESAEAGELYDDWVLELGDSLDEIEKDAEVSDEKLFIKVVTPVMSSTLRKLTVSSYDGDSTTDVLDIELGKNGIEKTNLIKVTLRETTVYSFEIKENSSDCYEAVLEYSRAGNKYTPAGIQKTLAAISIMKKNDTVRMKFNDGETIVSGTWKTKSNATTITLDEFKVDGETVKDAVTLTVVIDEKDSAPKPKKQGEVSNIFEMTEQDFEAIEERFSTAFGK